VTILGPGGAGKTRLAVEAARREQGEVWFAELATLTGAEDLATARTTARAPWVR
jgi:predicted ATPase